MTIETKHNYEIKEMLMIGKILKIWIKQRIITLLLLDFFKTSWNVQGDNFDIINELVNRISVYMPKQDFILLNKNWNLNNAHKWFRSWFSKLPTKSGKEKQNKTINKI